MIPLWVSFLLFLPIFLAVNLIAAIPGRADLKEALRVGLRHFLYGTLIVVVSCVVLHYLMVWLIARPPLF